eukprot:g6501.t1
MEHLPRKAPIVQKKSKTSKAVEEREWANKVAKAIATVFCSLDEAFAELHPPSGTTISLALLCGSLLTIANVGDSEVFLDTSKDIFPMTECHKVDAHLKEQTRLRNAGVTLSSYLNPYMSQPTSNERLCGPLRVWPGGIAISRSLGDFECCEHVIPNASVKQVIVPKAGARLIMATDGLWDYISGEQACELIRTTKASQASAQLFQELKTATRNCRLMDDTTILVVDLLPKRANYDFSTLCKRRKTKSNVWIKLKGVFKKTQVLKSSTPFSIYSSLDTAVAFPHIMSRGHSIFHDSTSESSSEDLHRSAPHGEENELHNVATDQLVSEFQKTASVN